MGIAKLGADKAGIRIHRSSPREKGRKDSDAGCRVKAVAAAGRRVRLLSNSEHSKRVFVRGPDEVPRVLPTELGDAGGGVRYICGFIELSALRDRREIRCVGLDEDRVPGQRSSGVLDPDGLLERDDPAEGRDESQIEGLRGKRRVLAEAVDDAADVAGLFVA